MFSKNEVHKMRCEAFGSDAAGVCRHQGMAVFVPGMLPGEEGLIRLLRVKDRYAYGRLETLLVPSQDRRVPPCPIAGKCGGCCCQHMRYEATLEYKRSQAEQLLRRVGGCEAPIPPIAPAADPWGYRNKGAYAIAAPRSGRPAAGFFRPRSHDLIPLPPEGCRIQRRESAAAVSALLSYMEREGVPAYDEKTGRGCVRHLMTRTAPGGETVVTIVTMNGSLPRGGALVRQLRQALPSLTGVVQLLKEKADNAILDGAQKTLWGEPDLFLPLCDRRFRVSPKSFFQVHPTETERLYGIVGEFAALTGGERVLDAYCGAGSIALTLASHAGQVLGLEIVPEAVHNARENAAREGVANAEFREGAVEDLLPRLAADGYRPDVIVLDPPRKGCEAAVLSAAAAANPSRLIYVSCGIATLARDLARLRELGYTPQAIRCVDMFSWTGDVETVVQLSKGNIQHKSIQVEFPLDDLDTSCLLNDATYQQIQDYVLEHAGLKVSTLYIAQVKSKHGIIERDCYNKSKVDGNRVPKCPPEKEKAIEEALRHFKMI